MDAADYLSRSSRNLRSSVETFTDEVEGELEKYSICGVHLTRKVTVPICACLVLVAIVLGVSLGTKTGAPPPGAADVYTEDHRYWSLGETIESSVGSEIFEEGTSENRALHWLAEEDPRQLPVTSTMEDILERFILANFYFATNGPAWKKQFDFLSEKDVCDWNDGGKGGVQDSGVFCIDGKVRKLNFNENGLSGTISEDIGLLSNTREFRVEGNAIEGTIPKSFGLMRELLGLNLHNNKIHGIFPQSLATLKQLEVAKFSNNRLEGLDGIGIWKQLPNLQVIHLFNNTLTGRLGDWGDIPQLQILNIANNQITGTIPPNFGVDKELQRVDLGNNLIRGSIPPEFFSSLSPISFLNLGNNELTGTVPPTVSDMALLKQLYLNDNNMYGNLPESISIMTNLNILDISATQIGTDVESILCSQNKVWQTLRADCLKVGSSASCATECCHPDGYCCDMMGQTACEVPP
ncbi:RHS repeat-associated core domain containing protein [Nitzschia inconspicua]|uniref:RHS repeat-associated core domain containing protein n=1 Tax=Nitzschia inconspicua TaxID=303405 RepID=A0A9K3LE40_9STRA|nr:RHS repeat-associated core domain containing protein [Nitzschia inconspicua]